MTISLILGSSSELLALASGVVVTFAINGGFSRIT
jgi:hypothetical protein